MQQHGSKYFARRPLPYPQPWGLESLGQRSTFSEHGHVIYQIKDNHKCSNTVANILPAVIPDPGDGVNRLRFNFFQNMVTVHIKLKRITSTATW